jgi:hypothetical protein
VRRFKDHVSAKVFFFGGSGCTSEIMAKSLQGYMREHGLEQFGPSDIVLVDHSVNDAIAVANEMELAIQIGLEELIRGIFHLSPRGLPNVVLLEQYPHNDFQGLNAVKGSQGGSYTGLYRRLAAHYKLALWSYRDYIWAGSSSLGQPHLIDALRRFGNHPPWHGHLHVANIFAGCLLRSLESCSGSGAAHIAAPPRVLADLPAPLCNHSQVETNFCDSTSPYALDVEPAEYASPENVTEFESSLTGWTALADRHGEPGWIINNRANASLATRKLSFIIRYPRNEAVRSYAIKIKYLKTYVNAGRVVIYLCGKEIGILDTLSEDFATYKVSLPHYFLYKPITFDAECEWLRTNRKARKLEFVYVSKNSKRKSGLGDSKARAVVRGSEKVKILGVQMCLPMKAGS